VELLINRGADIENGTAEPALEMTIAVRFSKCTALLVAKGLSREDYSVALPNIAVFGDVNAVRLVQREEIGCDRVHQRSATERIDSVDVRAVVEHL
jgi:hypothetical protein